MIRSPLSKRLSAAAKPLLALLLSPFWLSLTATRSQAAEQSLSFASNTPQAFSASSSCVVGSFADANAPISKSTSAKLVTLGTRNNSTHVISIDSPYGFNEAAGRHDVAKAFYTQNPDSYDFLFVFSDFEFPVPVNAGAYYHPVRNDVQGINMPIGDSGALFGSAKQLQGYVDMTWMSRYTFKRTDPNYQVLMKTAMHEVMHRYGPNVRYKNAANEVKTDLGNPVNKPHWSFALDSDASIMYGARWALQPNNSYRATETVARLSPLDLYVAGWGSAAEVPDLKLLQMQPQPTGDVPELGQIITAPALSVPMAQIIAAEGARVPAFPAAQNQYRAAIIFLTRPGVTASNARLLELDMFRRTFEDYFDGMTGGRASISFKLDETQTVLTGPTVLDSSVPTGGTGITAAIDWLESKAYYMPVSDRASSAVRDTMSAYLALIAAKPASPQIAVARNWLAQSNVKSADAAAAMLLKPKMGPSS